MADKKPKIDVKAVTNEYINGATLADLAEKYELPASEIEKLVVKEPTD